MAVKAGLWLAAPAVAWWGGLVRPGEKRQVRELIASARRAAGAQGKATVGALGR